MSIQPINGTTATAVVPYAVPEVFTVSELVKLLFIDHHLTPADLENFGRVCRKFLEVTPDIWKYFRAKKGYTYDWKLCQGREASERIHYKLSDSLVRYCETFRRVNPKKAIQTKQRRTKLVKEREKIEAFWKPFPLLKTFVEATCAAKNRKMDIWKFDTQLKKEPLLHAAIQIYSCANAVITGNTGMMPLMPPEMVESAHLAVSSGATFLSRLAVSICSTLHPAPRVLKYRFMPFLWDLSLQAKQKGDSSGLDSLAEFAERTKMFDANSQYFQGSRSDLLILLDKQLCGDLSADDYLSEIELFKKLHAQLDDKNVNINQTAYVACPVMRRCVQLGRYEEAKAILDKLRLRNVKMPDAANHLAEIKINIHFNEFDKANALYDKLISKNGKIRKDLSFLIEFALFKLESDSEDLDTADRYLMRYWENHPWNEVLDYNFFNTKLYVESTEDLKCAPFLKLIELIIEIKSKLGHEDDAAWFRDILALIKLDPEDKQAIVTLHKELIEHEFYTNPRNGCVPAPLKGRIKAMQLYGCLLLQQEEYKNPE